MAFVWIKRSPKKDRDRENIRADKRASFALDGSCKDMLRATVRDSAVCMPAEDREMNRV